ncbi:corticotropin-releasing factor-binding protein [Anopheles stephensi]|uniref:corticotropin-releasing factor-binding protein n=1 Tax=Anopheles stephensi TaxID=30069 RepID=UPI0007D1CDFC|nr:corticotropin-releasing factor-binding protein [Anopheles stephensi]XP_035919766.1 corticotropin-releasing factor-binding protein [Anopheles stephensi]
MAMRGVMMLFFQVLILCFQAKAWHAVRRSFELEQTAPQEKIHLITDCMHVTSEEGEFSFVKLPPVRSTSKHGAHWMSPGELSPELSTDGVANGSLDPDTLPDAASVCGVYFVANPDQTIEVTMKQVNVECRTGGLMAFVDGWELNGQYFPGERDHEKPLELRVQEFCAEQTGGPWPVKTGSAASNAWVFRSSQNAALVQYRIPERGSFVLSARFHHNPKPCNIMAEGLAPYYMLRNYGQRRNCTLTALFPAVVSVIALEVGEINESVRYCERVRVDDKLEIGGSVGLDPSYQLTRASTICGRSRGRMDLDQTILCGTTSVRLISSGRFTNQAMVTMRMADESDLRLATVICEM